MTTLSQRVAKGGFWIFGLRMTRRTLDFLRTVILARFLAPNDFGLMGIAILTLQTLEAFSQTGYQSALIQKKGEIKDYVNVAWTLLVLRGISLFLIILVSAPFVSLFFNSPDSKLIIQVLGLSFLIQGLTNPGIVYFQKELDFKKQYVYEISGIVFEFILSIILVFVFKNVWALVIGKVSGEIARLIASYALADHKLILRFNLSKAKELHHFGKWLSGSNILVFIATQGDSILVGKLLGAFSLGFYKLASTIANLPTTEITHVASQVAFPAYSKLQDDSERLKRAYLKTLYLTVILSFVIATSISILMSDFVKIFLGSKWLPIVSITQVLVVSGLIRSIAAVTGPLFQAVGKPQIDTFSQIIRLSVFLLCIYPLMVKFEMMGVAIAVLLSIIVTCIAMHYIALKIICAKVSELLSIFLPPLVASMTAYIFSFIVKKVFVTIGISEFILVIIVILAGYALPVFLIERKFSGYKSFEFLYNMLLVKNV